MYVMLTNTISVFYNDTFVIFANLIQILERVYNNILYLVDAE